MQEEGKTEYHCLGTCCDVGRALPLIGEGQVTRICTQEGELEVRELMGHEFSIDGVARCDLKVKNGSESRCYLVCTKPIEDKRLRD